MRVTSPPIFIVIIGRETLIWCAYVNQTLHFKTNNRRHLKLICILTVSSLSTNEVRITRHPLQFFIIIILNSNIFCKKPSRNGPWHKISFQKLTYCSDQSRVRHSNNFIVVNYYYKIIDKLMLIIIIIIGLTDTIHVYFSVP